MNEKGQTALEYVLVTVIIVLGIIFAFKHARVDNAIGNQAGHIQNSLLVDE